MSTHNQRKLSLEQAYVEGWIFLLSNIGQLFCPMTHEDLDSRPALSGSTWQADTSRIPPFVRFSSVQSLSRVRLFATRWTAAHQASLSITESWSLLKLMSIASVMPSNHLILCHPLPLLPSVFPSIRVSFQWVSSSHQVAKVLEIQLQHQSFQQIFRTDFL